LRKGPLAGAATPRERERQIAPKKARHFSLKITFEALGIKAFAGIGDRVYCATALLDILEEPARLKPAPNMQP
jgi:hypothetical protein